MTARISRDKFKCMPLINWPTQKTFIQFDIRIWYTCSIWGSYDQNNQFLRATAGTAVARLSHRNSVSLSVCLSDCLSHRWISQKRRKLRSPNFYRRLPGTLYSFRISRAFPYIRKKSPRTRALNERGVGKNCAFQPILEFMHWTWRGILKFMHWIWR